MEFRLLGPMTVLTPEGHPIPLPRGLARSLLALLALQPGRVIGTDRLVDALWDGSPPATAVTALQGHVSTLRRHLEPRRARGAIATVLVTRSPGYVLEVDPDHVDVIRFRRTVIDALQAAEPERRADALHVALAAWRGPPLADFAYEPFAQAPIRALRGLHLQALEARIEADLELGRHAEVLPEVETLVREHPLHEGIARQLALALYRCSRQAEALAALRDVRRRLVDQLGVEPGPSLQALERAVLRHDPALVPPVADRHGGLPPAGTPWLASGRRTVTAVVVGASVDGSGTLADPEAIAPVLARVQAGVRAALTRHGGTLEGAVGDVTVAVFGRAVAREDDPVRAIRAAAELRHDLASVIGEVGAPSRLQLRVRVGVASGEVVIDDVATSTSGPPVSAAARLQQLAADGEVVLGGLVRRLVEPVAIVEPLEGVDAWRLVDLAQPSVGFSGSGGSLVGRDAELDQLHAILRDTVASGRAGLVIVAGDPGVGKTRLAAAFAERVEDRARVVVGRCRAYGEGITFWPLREMVRLLVGGDGRAGLTQRLRGDDDLAWSAHRIGAAMCFRDGLLRQPEELFRAVQHLFQTAAADHPLVAVVDDLHWAQPAFLDLVEHLADHVDRAVLFLCLTRPEPTERRTGWTSRTGVRAITLNPLSAPDSRRLAFERLDGRSFPPETMGRVLARSQGNPLFLEQLLAAAREEPGATDEFQDVVIPPTLEGLVTARLDRLGTAERDVVRCASVIGTDVPLDQLATLLPPAARESLDHQIDVLATRELIRPWDGSGPRGFEFRHVLIQQAAYRTLTHDARAELHERAASWLREDGRQASDVEELVGHHLEQADRHRRVLNHAVPGGR